MVPSVHNDLMQFSDALEVFDCNVTNLVQSGLRLYSCVINHVLHQVAEVYHQ